LAIVWFVWFPRAGVGTQSGRASVPYFSWFPRAGVGTQSGRASVSLVSRSHAPAWERILEVQASRAASPQRRDAGASKLDSHAGAWEPENQRLTSVHDTYV